MLPDYRDTHAPHRPGTTWSKLQEWFTIYKKFPEIPVEKQMDHVFSDSSGGKF